VTALGGDAPRAAEETVADVHALLRMMVFLQDRGQRVAADRMHDGPMQDFTAILLELATIRRQLPAALSERISSIEDRLRTTSLGLQPPPNVFRISHDARQSLAAGLSQRVDGLLVDQLETDLRVETHPPTLTEIAVSLAAVQLLLAASSPHRPAEQAWLTAESRPDGLDLRLRVRPRGPRLETDPTRSGLLRSLADLIGARLAHDPADSTWSATLHVSRIPRPPRPPRPAADG
jgi:signal transduction histidine kinase